MNAIDKISDTKGNETRNYGEDEVGNKRAEKVKDAMGLFGTLTLTGGKV